MKTMHILQTLAFVAALVAPALSQPAYRTIEVKDGGKISGFVRLSADVPDGLEFPVQKDNDWCGTKKKSPRLVVGKEKGVGNAVISLEGISAGKKFAEGKYVLDQRKCEYVPHVMLLPIGAPLVIVNSDAVLHNVHTYGTQGRTVFNIAQPIKGVRFPVNPSKFSVPGAYHATCDAGHPWMSAYIIVTDHPYYAISDVNGKFELSDVPPGMYRIRMWHEGVHVTRTDMSGLTVKAYQYEAPYEEVREIVMPAGGNVTVDFALELRPAALVKK